MSMNLKKFMKIPRKVLLKNNIKLLMAILMTMSLTTFPFPLIGNQDNAPTKEQMIELLGGHEGSVDFTEKRDPYGVVEYSMVVKQCDGSNCETVLNKVWRSSTGYVNIDGHYYLAETLDAFNKADARLVLNNTPSFDLNGNLHRLQYSAAVAEPSKDKNEFDPGTLSTLRMDMGPSGTEFLREVMPTVIIGIKDGIDDFNRSLAASKQIHDAYMSKLNQAMKVVTLNNQEGKNISEASQLNSGMNSIQLGILLGSNNNQQGFNSSNSERIKDIEQFRQNKKNPLTYKRYDLTKFAKEKMYSDFFSAASSGKVKKAQDLAEILLNQRDPEAIKEAEEKLSKYVSNGVIKVKSILPQLPSAPFDDNPFFETSPDNPGGQIIRRAANLAQSNWANTDGYKYASEKEKASYIAALSAIKMGDEAFYQNNYLLAFAFVDMARTLLDVSIGFYHGLKNGTIDTIKSIPDMAILYVKGIDFMINMYAKPEETSEAFYRMAVRTPGFVKAVFIHAITSVDEFVGSSPEKHGEILGRLSFEVLPYVLAGGSIKTLLSASEGLSITEKMGASAKSLQALMRESKSVSAIKSASKELFENALNQLSKENLTGFKKYLQIDSEGALALLKKSSGTMEDLSVAVRAAEVRINKILDSAEKLGIKTPSEVTNFANISKQILKADADGLSILDKIVEASKNINPKLGNKYVQELPDLQGSLKEAFDGHIFKGQYEPGSILFQAQRTGQSDPGRWFLPIKPINAEHAEELANLKKWGNDASQIKVFKIKERVSGYAGKIEGGSGHQFFIPKEIPLSDVIEEVIF